MVFKPDRGREKDMARKDQGETIREAIIMLLAKLVSNIFNCPTKKWIGDRIHMQALRYDEMSVGMKEPVN